MGRRGWYVTGAVVVILALAGAGFVWVGGDDPPEVQQIGGRTAERLAVVDLPEPDGAEAYTPLVRLDRESMYVAQYERLRVFDVATGRERWNVGLGNVTGLDATGGLVVAQTNDEGGDYRLVAVDATTGERRWTSGEAGASRPTR